MPRRKSPGRTRDSCCASSIPPFRTHGRCSRTTIRSSGWNMIALKYESINHRCAFYLKSWHGNKATRCITLQTAAFLSLRGDVFSPRSITECSGFSDSASHSSGGLSTTIQVWTGNEGRTMVSTLNHALKMPYAVGVRVLTGFSIVYTDSIYR